VALQHGAARPADLRPVLLQAGERAVLVAAGLAAESPRAAPAGGALLRRALAGALAGRGRGARALGREGARGGQDKGGGDEQGWDVTHERSRGMWWGAGAVNGTGGEGKALNTGPRPVPPNGSFLDRIPGRR